MAYTFTERKRIRKSFGSRDSVLEVPYLLQMQKDAYTAFLQADLAPTRRTFSTSRKVPWNAAPIPNAADARAILGSLLDDAKTDELIVRAAAAVVAYARATQPGGALPMYDSCVVVLRVTVNARPGSRRAAHRL